MTCSLVMLTEPRTVSPKDTVPDAMELMHKFGMRNIPVVDDDGIFLGVFSIMNVIKLLLPKAATIEGGLDDLSYVHDTLDDVRGRLEEIRSHAVGDYIVSEGIGVASPDTSIMEAMLLLYQTRTHVTVVDPGTKKVKGVVTANTLLKSVLDDD